MRQVDEMEEIYSRGERGGVGGGGQRKLDGKPLDMT